MQFSSAEQVQEYHRRYSKPIRDLSGCVAILNLIHIGLPIGYYANKVGQTEYPGSSTLYNLRIANIALMSGAFCWFFGAAFIQAMRTFPSSATIFGTILFALAELGTSSSVFTLTNNSTRCAARVVRKDGADGVRDAKFTCNELKNISITHFSFALVFWAYATILIVVRCRISKELRMDAQRDAAIEQRENLGSQQMDRIDREEDPAGRERV